MDNVSIGATSVGTAESDEGWAFDGFSMTTGSEMQSFDNYYVVENRQYLDNDRSLEDRVQLRVHRPEAKLG